MTPRYPTLLAGCLALASVVGTPRGQAADEVAPQANSDPAPTAPPTSLNQRALPSIAAVKTVASPTIDGVLDDDVWDSAAVIDAFTQVFPVEGAPPSQKTQVRVLFSKDALYLAIRCYDNDPTTLSAKVRQRDGDLSSDDFVTVTIDTLNDNRTGYQFDIGAAGAKRDSLITSAGQTRLEWDGIWYAKTSIDAEGYVVEMAIPFKTVIFDPGSEAWGFNFARNIRRTQEVVRWASPTQNTSARNMADAGDITGLVGLEKGMGITFKPFFTGKADLKDDEGKFQPGFDLYWRLTPSITAAITVNTDFAEADVDDRRVNLTRFPLFFPEKREFFLQDAGVFRFGGIFNSPLPFFSRRIGIVGGEEKGILAGVRVSGRHQGLSFGVLDVQMDEDDELGEKNLGVARATLDILEESTVGVIATHGDPGTQGDNTLVGTDFNFRNSKVFGDKVVEATAWIMHTSSTEEGNEDATATGGRLSYPNDDVSLSLFAARIGEDFNPALGFVERTGVYEYNGNARYRWRTPGYWRRIDLGIDPEAYYFIDGPIQSLEAGLPEFEVENKFGDEFFASHRFNRENLLEPFDITDDVTIDEGDYRFHRYETGFESATSRIIAMRGTHRGGEFYNGHRTDWVGAIDWRPDAMFVGTFEYELNEVELPGGDFDVRIIRSRAAVYFTPELSWTTSVQWDNRSNRAGVNSRVRWEFEPGDDVFIVFNQGLIIDDTEVEEETSELSVKVGLTFRF